MIRLKKYFICNNPRIHTNYFNMALWCIMTNSPHINIQCVCVETKHRSGHNLFAVRYHKAALNKHPHFYSSFSPLWIHFVYPQIKDIFHFALFGIAHALSKNLRHYSVNYLYCLLQKVLLRDFATQHWIPEGNQINSSWDRTIKDMFSPMYSSLLMASRRWG